MGIQTDNTIQIACDILGNCLSSCLIIKSCAHNGCGEVSRFRDKGRGSLFGAFLSMKYSNYVTLPPYQRTQKQFLGYRL